MSETDTLLRTPSRWTALAALAVATFAAAAPAATAPADPWPTAAVLTRLFTLPAGQADGQRLIRDLKLETGQIQELKRLAASEASYGEAGRRLFGRDQATALNVNIAKFTQEKDRKVRLALGDRYPTFRTWVRSWWATKVAVAK